MEWLHTFLHDDNSTKIDKPLSFFFFRDSNYDMEMNIKSKGMKEETWYWVGNDLSRDALILMNKSVVDKATASVFEDYQSPETGAKRARIWTF